mmetsp:Transcript_18825/g.28212  ORF Transcript_18825/g.28212 Transcript_18825/m.28212 type:complete len:223 (+) Transcript_18825:2226-2894(+)
MFCKPCARCLSDGLAVGSSQLLEISCGILSCNCVRCCSRSSLRSLAKALCVRAALFSEPSGFFTTFTGSRSVVSSVWPCRNEGSSSRNSISNSSSVSSTIKTFFPSLSRALNTASDLLMAPEATSLVSSHLSCSERVLCGRVSLSSLNLRSRLGREGFFRRSSRFLRFIEGRRSSPVFWFTSRMDNEILLPIIDKTFTFTFWPLLISLLISIIRPPGRIAVI